MSRLGARVEQAEREAAKLAPVEALEVVVRRVVVRPPGPGEVGPQPTGEVFAKTVAIGGPT